MQGFERNHAILTIRFEKQLSLKTWVLLHVIIITFIYVNMFIRENKIFSYILYSSYSHSQPIRGPLSVAPWQNVTRIEKVINPFY